MSRKIKNLVKGFKDSLLNARRTRRKASLYVRQPLKRQMFHSLQSEYRDSWLIQKICTMKGEDGLKNWIDISGDSKLDDKIKAVQDKIKEIGLREKLLQCSQYADAYGGGAIVLNIADGLDDAEPVDIEKVTELTSINVVEGTYLSAGDYSDDLTESNHGEPLNFHTGDGVEFDASRIVRMVGVKLGKHGTVDCQGYGDPITHKMQEAIKSFGFACDGVEDLMIDFSTKVLSIEGLISKLLNNKKDLEARLELLNESTSIDGMLVISEKEELKKVSVSLAGIDSLLNFVLDVVSGASGYPRAKLFSQQLGTLAGAKEGTGDYVRQVEIYREDKYNHAIDYILRLLFTAEGVDYSEIEWEFNAVETVSDASLVETQEKSAKTVLSLFNAGIIEAEEARAPFVAGSKSNALKLATADIEMPVAKETAE